MIKLISFTMPGCSFCQKQKPVLDEVVKELDIEVERINTENEKARHHAEKYNVKSFPTLFIIKNEIIVDVIIGHNPNLDDADSKMEMKKRIQSHYEN
jgi:thiol-disulfide isomerase/thioredoxin